MRRLLPAVSVLAALLVVGGAPSQATATFTTQEVRLPMSDGVELAATLYTPAAPRVAQPGGVLVLHGIGGTRGSVAAVAEAIAAAGHAALAYDARGHGQSGGLFSAAGPREIADVREVAAWLAARPNVNDDAIGAWGISYGGGQVLRALVDGVLIRTAVVAETWTDLYSALVPGGLAKSGAVLGFLNSVPAERRAPEVNEIAADALGSRNLPRLRAWAAQRSSRAGLGRIEAPVLFLQGRRDFAFGLDQGLAARRGLPLSDLYIGPFGHAPSRFPGPDVATVLARTVDWFNRTFEGLGEPLARGITIAPDPYRAGGTRRFAQPPTNTVVFTTRGTSTVRGAASFTRSLGRTAKLLETFGQPLLTLRASGTMPHVVAVLKARTPAGADVTVSAGGAKVTLGRRTRTVRIRLIGQVTTIPRGSRLSLRIGSTSGDLLYLAPAPAASRLGVGRVTLSLPTLLRPVSRP